MIVVGSKFYDTILLGIHRHNAYLPVEIFGWLPRYRTMVLVVEHDTVQI